MNRNLIVLTFLAAVCLWGCNSETQESPSMPDLSRLDKGTYAGQASYKKRSYQIEVVVDAGEIRDIRARRADGRADKYDKKAMTVLARVVSSQSLDVDVKTGATPISKALVRGVEEALCSGSEPSR
jgi:uncharacterized protein with FMN-binding domain